MCTRIQPCKPARQGLDFQLTIPKKSLVDSRNLIFSPGGRPYIPRDLNNLIRIKIKTDHRIIALRMLRLLLNRKTIALPVKLRHPVALRVIHPISEHGSFPVLLRSTDRLLKHPGKPGAMENVVPKDKTCGIAPDEISPDSERLCQTVRRRLLRILKTDTIIRTAPKKPPEPRQILRS